MAEPFLRASGAKLMLSVVDSLPGPTKTRILAGVAPAVRESITGATDLAWLPIATHGALVTAVNAVLVGEERRKFNAQVSNAYANLTLLKPVLGIVARMGLISPKSLMKSIPVSWNLTARDCGKFQFVDLPDSGRANVLMTEVPPQVFSELGFLQSMISGFHVVFDLCKTTGTITSLSDLGRREVTFAFQWTAR